ncbi:MAG: DUF6672 family protein [Candidatus Shapirobacteria bacterium]|jgi:hypothetical protein
MKMKLFGSRKSIVRSILVVVYLGLIVLMLFTGKQHTILIDNKDAKDGSYTAIDGMTVQIDKQEAYEYYPGDRDKAIVKGQKHKIKVELFEDGSIIEDTFTVPLGQDMVLLSVPKLVAKISPYVESFTIQQEQASAPDAGPRQSMQFGGDSPVVEDEAAPEAPLLIQ